MNIVLDEDNKALDYVMGALSVGQKDISILIEDINDFNYHPHFDKNDVLKVTAFLETIKEFKVEENKKLTYDQVLSFTKEFDESGEHYILEILNGGIDTDKMRNFILEYPKKNPSDEYKTHPRSVKDEIYIDWKKSCLGDEIYLDKKSGRA